MEKQTIVLASNNKHKIKEISNIMSDFNIVSMKDIGFFDDIVEDRKTLYENAEIKAKTIFEYCKKNGLDVSVMADDTGLFVEALNGEPGVYSARYSGDHDDEGNRQKLLKNLDGQSDRSAYFACVICFISKDEKLFFEGRTQGFITKEKIGNDSFGYDCLFFSDDLNKTFGESTEEEKDLVSHRGRAVLKLNNHLKTMNKIML